MADKEKNGGGLRQVRQVALLLSILVLVGVVGVLAWRLTGGGNARVGQQTTSGEPAIGGPFTLTDHDGRRVTAADFRGRYMLVFFGYTFCPDVCPTTLTEISTAMDLLGEQAERVQPLFVSVDPARDTVAALKDYMSNFDPRILGLTGSAEEVKQAAKAYRVYYSKVVPKDGDPEDYLMDHSSVIYLMGPDGKFVTHFSYQTPGEKIAARLKKIL